MKTKDGYMVETIFHDGAHPPPTDGSPYRGQKVGKTSLWIRLPGDDWHMVTQSRSMTSVRATISLLDLIDLKALILSNML
jgi:hypothetical protein